MEKRISELYPNIIDFPLGNPERKTTFNKKFNDHPEKEQT